MTNSTSFSVTWDYRCPFARNAHEHVLEGLAAGADWDVRFVAFSLSQMHVEQDEPPVWDRPEEFPGLLANMAGAWVRDHQPEAFPDVHRALFAARHDDARDLRELDVIADVLQASGAETGPVLESLHNGEALALVRTDHLEAEREHGVWGVPTFVVDGQAVFIRFMHRPAGDGELARSTIDRVLDVAGGWPELNELKHTRIPR